jgi:hypothetical protein
MMVLGPKDNLVENLSVRTHDLCVLVYEFGQVSGVGPIVVSPLRYRSCWTSIMPGFVTGLTGDRTPSGFMFNPVGVRACSQA